MAEKKKTTKKAPAKKASAKKAPVKKKDTAVPPNPSRDMGAVVRTVRCDKAKAAELVGEYGFFVVGKSGDEYTCCADQRANSKYESRR